MSFRLLALDLNQPALNGRRTDMADRYAAKAVFHRRLLQPLARDLLGFQNLHVGDLTGTFEPNAPLHPPRPH